MPECCVVPIIQKLCQAVRIWRSRWAGNAASPSLTFKCPILECFPSMLINMVIGEASHYFTCIFHTIGCECIATETYVPYSCIVCHVCIYESMKWDTKTYKRKEFNRTPHGGPCQPKRGQEIFLRCKIAKWINEMSWEILQFRCGLSSYHPALARLGYQDSSWIV